MWTPQAYKKMLQGLGFGAVESHWHWPDFEACKMMIPLEQGAAMEYAFRRGGRGLKARLTSTVGQLIVRSGLLTRTAPSFSLLARREDS